MLKQNLLATTNIGTNHNIKEKNKNMKMRRNKGKQQWQWFSVQPLIDDEEVDCTFLTSQVSHEQKALAVCNAAEDF